jgi:hypothetical protein
LLLLLLLIEWAILIPWSALQLGSEQQLPVRLFDINDADIYVSSNYLRETSSIEISILVGTRFSRRSIYLNRSLTINNSIILNWMSPLMVIFMNCSNVGSFAFEIKNESDALSLPFFKPNSLMWGGNGEFFRTVREALLKASCVNSEFIFPTEQNQIITIATTTTTTATTITQTSSVPSVLPTVIGIISGI